MSDGEFDLAERGFWAARTGLEGRRLLFLVRIPIERRPPYVPSKRRPLIDPLILRCETLLGRGRGVIPGLGHDQPVDDVGQSVLAVDVE